MDKSRMKAIAGHFALDGKVKDVESLGNGLINDTYLVSCEGPDVRYVLQRVNTEIFRDPVLLQANIKAVTEHIANVLRCNGVPDIERRVLSCIDTIEGLPYYDDGGGVWRMTRYIADSRTISDMTPELARITGCAFGEFHAMLAMDDAPQLGESIPNFHNLPFRLKQLRDAVAADSCGRLASVRDIVDELLARADEMTLAERLFAAGELPRRICHCDTKIDNILFGKDGNVLCVIDLDTTMPGFVMSDFGDFIRTAGNKGKEDDTDLEAVEVDMDIFKAFAEGYISQARFLTDVERKTLPYGAQRMVYMQTVRFLSDYLNGDTYYKIAYPEHNIVRTRAQYKLLQSLDANLDNMNKVISEI